MPRGRGWRGGRAQEACLRRIDRFLESCLLLLLHCSEVHGYELLEGLRQFGFEQSQVDSSSIRLRVARVFSSSLVGFPLSRTAGLLADGTG